MVEKEEHCRGKVRAANNKLGLGLLRRYSEISVKEYNSSLPVAIDNIFPLWIDNCDRNSIPSLGLLDGNN